MASPPAREALARYAAGDLVAARAALAASTADPQVAALAARLEAIARLLGPDGAWPPPGGAAALERLLELEAALALATPSPFAARAAAELADRHVEKASHLADDGRWEEARMAFDAALRHRPEHAPARKGLERVEQAAWALYLEGYALEEDDPAGARRRYVAAARLARPDGSLARRIAARLAAIAGVGP